MEYDELKIAFRPRNGDGTYRVDASFDGNSVPGTMKLEIDERDLKSLALSVATRARGGRRGSGAPAVSDVERIGRQLFESLFCDQIGERYRLSVEKAGRRKRGVRITLSMRETPELIHLPWELLCDPQGNFLSLSNATPVVRHLDILYPRDPLALEPPLRILGVVSSPKGDKYGTLETEREQANLEAAVAPLVEDGRIELHWLEEATAEDLQLALRKADFHIFHFIGHGGYDSEAEESHLIFEGKGGQPWEMSGDALGVLLGDHSSLRLVVLNSCEGARGSAKDPFAGVAATLIKELVPAVIAMQFEITDEAAIVFSGRFYDWLVDGDPLDTALTEARKMVYRGGENKVEWATPVLFTRVGNGRVFAIDQDEDEQARSRRRARLISTEQEASEAKAKPVKEPLPTQSPPVPPPNALAPELPSAVGVQPQVGNLVRRGQASLLRRHNARAFDEFDRALQIDPESVEALSGRGEANRRLHRITEAEADFAGALAFDPRACEALVGRAWARLEVDRLEEAAEDVIRALDVDPDLAEALAARGFIELQQVPSRRSEALADFEGALRLDPGLTEATVGIAVTIGREDTDRALSLLEPAIEKDPLCVEAIAMRGLLRSLKGDAGAVEDLDRAVTIDPRSPDALQIRGIARMMRGAYREALADFEQIVAQLPPSRTARVQMGYAHLGLNDPSAALVSFDQALELRPGAAPPLVGRGVAKVRLGRFADGLADFEAALAIDPLGEGFDLPLGELLLWRGLAKLRIDQPLEALEDFEAGLARGVSETASVLTWRAEAHMALGDIKSAYEDQTQAASLEPGSAEVLAARDRILEALGHAAALKTAAEQPMAEREQRNRELLAGSALERNWYSDQRTAMVEKLGGREDLLWLCRCRRSEDVMRQTALLLTSERLLWCRRALIGSPEPGELSWRDVDSVGGEGENVTFISPTGTTTFVVGGNKGIDLGWQALQLDARDLRALATGLITAWRSMET